MRSDFDDAREVVRKNTGIDISFEAANRYSSDTIDDNENFKAINDQLKSLDNEGKLSPETIASLQAMLDITDDLEAHSTVGTDRFLQNVGMSKYRDQDKPEYRSSGTGGKADDLEGIGESNIGTGIGERHSGFW